MESARTISRNPLNTFWTIVARRRRKKPSELYPRNFRSPYEQMLIVRELSERVKLDGGNPQTFNVIHALFYAPCSLKRTA